MRNRASVSGMTLLFAALVGLAAAGCSPIVGGNAPPAYKTYLYLTDTYAGKVYAYDPATHTQLASYVAATGKNGTGEIEFYKGIGYVAVGFGSDEGVYRFDPSATSPTFTKIGGMIAAQYFAFYGATKAYVSSFDYSGPTAGLYYFDPTNPNAGLTSVAALAGKQIEEVVVGTDGFVYAADNGGKVLRIDPADDTLKATVLCNAGGTTGLFVGTYNGGSGVFVANTAGSIDFVGDGALDGTTATPVASNSIYPARVLQLPNGNLVATGYDPSYANHSYLVTLGRDSDDQGAHRRRSRLRKSRYRL